jgi:hypothetical protein
MFRLLARTGDGATGKERVIGKWSGNAGRRIVDMQGDHTTYVLEALYEDCWEMVDVLANPIEN